MSLNRLFSDPLIETLASEAKSQKVWLVGGSIRDQLLDRRPLDFDFAVETNARDLARRFADACGGVYFELDGERDTGRVILRRSEGSRRTIDFARLRGADITADLLARDFSINALAIPLEDPSQLIDPTEGLQDLKDKILRACSSDALEADPVRILRAIRIATDFELQIEPNTSQQIKAAGERLSEVSAERLRDEFMRILDLDRPTKALRVLDHLGILTIILPELEALRDFQQPSAYVFDGLAHTLAVSERLRDLLGVLASKHDPDAPGDIVLAQTSFRLGRFREQIRKLMLSELSTSRTRRQLLQLAALYHDVGKPDALGIEGGGKPTYEQISADKLSARARQLRLSGKEIDHLEKVVRHHKRIEQLEGDESISDRGIYRFFRDTGDAGVDVVLISLADCLGKYAGAPPEDVLNQKIEASRQLLTAFFEDHEQRIDPKAVITGSELLSELNLQPGPEIGRLLEVIREAQASGEVHSREEALILARTAMKEGKP
jgi:tRNA nucleotidyltransferase/poly(A) polymerase